MTLKSKKFFAFILAMVCMTGLLGLALLTQTFTLSMSLYMTCGIISIAAMSIGYVINQTALDKFVRGFPIRKGDSDGNSNTYERREG